MIDPLEIIGQAFPDLEIWVETDQSGGDQPYEWARAIIRQRLGGGMYIEGASYWVVCEEAIERPDWHLLATLLPAAFRHAVRRARRYLPIRWQRRLKRRLRPVLHLLRQQLATQE
jgi:hypothetical protein